MGGFEGGDEGGFWDIEELISSSEDLSAQKSTKRAALKELIEQNNGTYSLHTDLMISFVPHACQVFTVENEQEFSKEAQIIKSTYQAVVDFTADTDISEFFTEYKVLIQKASHTKQDSKISTSVAFIYLLKEACSLILTDEEIENIANSIESKN